ncbi:MAG: glycosyltransferase family 2 protein [Micrococcales bacterium]|nr:glycosyltransferase family 2 protein [Micrococcales bacterium]
MRNEQAVAQTLTIVTPTYDRATTLPRLYDSLVAQTDRRFTWIVVDDGSTDDTEQIVQGFAAQRRLDVTYVKQANGGKHTALNAGISRAASEATMIVDSDDWLTPDAVECVLARWPIVVEHGLAGITFLKGYSGTDVLGDAFLRDETIQDPKDVYFNKAGWFQATTGDKAEVFDTQLLKQTPFPVVPGERFMTEGVVWKQLWANHNMLFVNRIIYVAEYLPGGLTMSGRRLLIRNPRGAMLNARLAMTRGYAPHVRLRNALLYTAYGYYAGKRPAEAVQDSGHVALACATALPGWLLFRLWRHRYGARP